jgi:hypothetical protein
MVGLPEMLTAPAEEAGIKVPPNLDYYMANEYPHWEVFCTVQLGAPMPCPTALWDNAHIIAKIPQDKICLVTLEELIKMGIKIGFSK